MKYIKTAFSLTLLILTTAVTLNAVADDSLKGKAIKVKTQKEIFTTLGYTFHSSDAMFNTAWKGHKVIRIGFVEKNKKFYIFAASTDRARNADETYVIVSVAPTTYGPGYLWVHNRVTHIHIAKRIKHLDYCTYDGKFKDTYVMVMTKTGKMKFDKPVTGYEVDTETLKFTPLKKAGIKCHCRNTFC